VAHFILSHLVCSCRKITWRTTQYRWTTSKEVPIFQSTWPWRSTAPGLYQEEWSQRFSLMRLASTSLLTNHSRVALTTSSCVTPDCALHSSWKSPVLCPIFSCWKVPLTRYERKVLLPVCECLDNASLEALWSLVFNSFEAHVNLWPRCACG